MKKIINWLRIRKWRKIIKESGMFDEKYYLFTYPDVRNKDIDPITHFLVYAAKEKRNPSLGFDTSFYLESNNDVTTKKINPLLHYILHGKQEKRAIKKENITNVTKNKFKLLQFPNFKTPLVSIIIPVYNQFHYTYACLSSILKSTTETSYEIIIADDLSTDRTVDIEKICKNIQVIHNTKNLGFLLNCNNAANYARGRYIHFLNNDTQVKENWLSSLVELIESDKKIGMVGSKLVYPDGRLQEAGGIIWNDASGWNYGRLDNPSKFEYNYVKEVDYISGASIMIRTNLWQKIGGFDERYTPAYYEDADLAFEVRKNGFKVLYQPKSEIVHFEGISNGTDTKSGIKQYQIINHDKFYNKWKITLHTENYKNSDNVFLAKKRSKNKKNILVIDHYVPEYDKDAGSRTMYQYLLEFIKLDYHVIFVPDNFNKLGHYGDRLERNGVEILYGTEFLNSGFENWLKKNSKHIDIVYLLRPHIAIKYLDLVKKYNSHSKIIYNGVDFHYLRLEREYDLSKNRHTKEEAAHYKNIEFKIFKSVDLVVTISDYEREIFNIEFPGKNIEVIPTYIYNKKFPLSKNNDFKNRQGILFVGGFSHHPNKDGLLWFIQNEWGKITSALPNCILNIVGSNAPKEVEELNDDSQINILGFISDEELDNLYDTCKIVIAPLRYGAGVKGKVIEAIAQGIPIVTTDIASEGIIDKNSIVKNVTDKDSFSSSLIELYSNEKEWYNFRSQQIEYAEKHFSKYSARDTIKNVFSAES